MDQAVRIVVERNILLAELVVKAAFREPDATWERKVELACQLGQRFRKALRPLPSEYEMFRDIPLSVLLGGR